MRISMRQQLITVKMSVTCLFLLTCGGAFPSDDPFYKGKMLTVIQGGTPGGSGDLRIRTVNKYLRQYLPGKPTILQKYLPGGGGIFATNHIVNSAKRDGLTVGVVGSSIYANAMLEARGARYRVKDLFFLGSPSPGGPLCAIDTAGASSQYGGRTPGPQRVAFCPEVYRTSPVYCRSDVCLCSGT